MKLVVVNYTGDRGNWGCQATSRNLLTFLREFVAPWQALEIGTVALPVEIRLDAVYEAMFGDRIRRIYEADDPSGEDLAFLDGLVRERFGRGYLQAREADVIVFQGEGTVGPVAHLRGVRLFALPLIAARLWKKPVFSMNQTLYAATPQDATTVASVFRKFDLVAVREARSLEFAREHGIPDVVLCPDLALREPRCEESVTQIPQPYFCVTGSAALKQFNPEPFVSTIREIAVRHGVRPVFMASRKLDRALMRCAEGVLGGVPHHVILSGQYPGVAQILPLLANARFVIGGRYHTALSALSQTVPVVLVPGNSFKSEGIAPMLGLDIPVWSVDDHDALLAEAARVLEAREAVREEIRGALSKVSRMQQQFGDYLAALIAGRLSGQSCRPEIPVALAADYSATISDRHHALYAAENSRPGTKSSSASAFSLGLMRLNPFFRRRIESSFLDLP